MIIKILYVLVSVLILFLLARHNMALFYVFLLIILVILMRASDWISEAFSGATNSNAHDIKFQNKIKKEKILYMDTCENIVTNSSEYEFFVIVFDHEYIMSRKPECSEMRNEFYKMVNEMRYSSPGELYRTDVEKLPNEVKKAILVRVKDLGREAEIGVTLRNKLESVLKSDS